MSARTSNVILGLSRHGLPILVTIAAAGIGVACVKWLISQRSRRAEGEVLTYSEVITYFVEQRPDDQRIRCGALLRAYDQKAWTMSFIFLDGARYGRTLRIRNLDAEMMELFSGKDLVIFQ